MTSTSANKNTTPQRREVATVQDVWRLSDLAGGPACAVLAAMQQDVWGNPECVCDPHESV